MIYFTSDTHFGHKKILEFERPQFKNIKEHDEHILSIIKSKLMPSDELWHLGDFGFLTKKLKEEWLNITCTKVLLLGNHDDNKKRYLDLFDKIIKYPRFITKRAMISHYPMPVPDGCINLHGHIHNGYIDLPNYINANIHMTNYKLISMKKLKKATIKLTLDDWHYRKEWYADYEVKTNNGKVSLEN